MQFIDVVTKLGAMEGGRTCCAYWGVVEKEQKGSTS
jgi:hypothetical protein